MIRLYGTEKGNSSWPRVSAGVREGLRACGKLASFYDVGRVDSDYDNDGDALEVGYDAPVGICIGSPSSASVMIGRGEHRERLLMIATNSSWLPPVMMERTAKICTGFLAPSHWSASVIAKHAPELPVYVYPHGVDEGFTDVTDGPVTMSGLFSALHLASTHMERKGTKELILGWALAIERGVIPKAARLRLVADGPRGYFNEAIHRASRGSISVAETYILQQRLDLKVADMAAMYRDHHIVVQPSRGEGFGLTPLEARACGVPVVATTCTGHLMHTQHGHRGVVVIEHGPEDAVDDGPKAKAPTVSPAAIADALGQAYQGYDQLSSDAKEYAYRVRAKWSWKAVTENFISGYSQLFEG